MANEVTRLDMEEHLTFEELHRMLAASRSAFHQYCATLLTECLKVCGGNKQQVRRFLETHDVVNLENITAPITSFTLYDKEYREKVATTLLACFGEEI